MLAHLLAAIIAWFTWLFGIRTKRTSEIGNGHTAVIVGGGFAGQGGGEGTHMGTDA